MRLGVLLLTDTVCELEFITHNNRRNKMIPFARMLEYGNVVTQVIRGIFSTEVTTGVKPPNRTMTRCTSDGTYIYCIAGNSSGGSTAQSNTVSRYNPTTKEWAVLSVLPVNLLYQGVQYLDGKIYVCGGTSNTSTVVDNSLYVYDIQTDTWSTVITTGVNMRNKRYFNLVTDGTYIYGCGEDADTLSGTGNLYRLDLETLDWSLLSTTGTGINGLSQKLIGYMGTNTVYLNGSIYNVNGDGYLKIYNISTGVWSAHGQVPYNGGCNLVVALGRVYMITRYSDVYMLDDSNIFVRAPDNVTGTIWYASEHCALHTDGSAVIYQFFGGTRATSLNTIVKKIT